MTRWSLLRQFSYVAFANYLAEGLFVVRGLVVAYVLGPAAFGVWSAVRLVLLLSEYTDAGTGTAMVQCSPHAEGAGSLRRALAHQRVAAGATLLGALVAAIVVAMALGGWSADAAVRRWWYLAALAIVTQQAMDVYESALAAQRRFGWIAVSESVGAVLMCVGGIVGALWFGLDGLLVSVIGSNVVLLVLLPIVGPAYPWPVLRWRHTLRLIVVAWPIVLAELLLVLLWSADKLMLWLLRPPRELGIYAIQSYFTAMVMLLPAVAGDVALPHLRWRLGRSKSPLAMGPLLIEGTRWLVGLGLPVIGLGALLLHLPIRWLLPAYEQAVAPGRLLMLASLPAISVTFSATVLIALSRPGQIIASRAAAVAVVVVGAGWALLGGGGLVELAMVMAVGLALHAVLLMHLAMRATGVRGRAVMPTVMGWIGGYAALVMLVVGLLILIPDNPATLLEDVVLSAVRCAVLLVVSAPLGWLAWRSLRSPAVGGVAS